jgi:hypothetical protein
MDSRVRLQSGAIRSVAGMIATAINKWKDWMFWVEVQSAFANSPETDEFRAETELWDSTVADGFHDEDW